METVPATVTIQATAIGSRIVRRGDHTESRREGLDSWVWLIGILCVELSHTLIPSIVRRGLKVVDTAVRSTNDLAQKILPGRILAPGRMPGRVLFHYQIWQIALPCGTNSYAASVQNLVQMAAG